MNLYDSRILLVDDNIELADMVHDMLRRNGYANVSCAHTCEEAIRVFRGESPQLVILDIMLPDGDGFTLLRRIRDISDVPILFLSAKDEDNDRLFGLGLGADDYITKPFLSQELLLRVNAVLKRTYFSSARIPCSPGGNAPGGIREPVRRSSLPGFRLQSIRSRGAGCPHTWRAPHLLRGGICDLPWKDHILHRKRTPAPEKTGTEPGKHRHL